MYRYKYAHIHTTYIYICTHVYVNNTYRYLTNICINVYQIRQANRWPRPYGEAAPSLARRAGPAAGAGGAGQGLGALLRTHPYVAYILFHAYNK